MSYLIVVISLLFAFFVMIKPRMAYFTATFLLPFMPRYFAIEFGSGMALSLKRLFIYILFGWIVISIMVARKSWSHVYELGHQWGFFIGLTATLYAFKLLSTLMGSGLYNLVYFIDDLLAVAVFILLAFRYLIDYRDIRIYIIILVSSLLLSEFMAVIEYSLGHPLLQGIINIEVYQSRDAMEGFVRENRYRTLAGFDNPLLLSEFICLLAPMLLACYSMRHRFLGITAGILLVPAIYFTGSRSGFIVLLFSIIISYIALFQSKIKILPGRFLVKFFIASASLLIMGIAVKSIFDPYWVVKTFSFLNSSTAEIISTMARLRQYEIVYKALTDNLVFGFGLMQNFSAIGVIGLDSYYLRLLLEGGVVVLLLYLVHIIYIITLSVRLVQNGNVPIIERKLAVSLLGSAGSFIVVRMFVSMPFNNTFFYTFAALTMILNSRYPISEKETAKYI